MGTVKLHAIVKENLDNEIVDFREFFTGEIHLDEKKHFYGPHERWGKSSDLLSFSLLSKYRKIKQSGNMKGEGYQMGSVMVVGPGDQGILYEKLETSLADRCDIDDVMAAVNKILSK